MTWEFELVAGPFQGAGDGIAWDGEAILFSVSLESRILRYDPKSGSISDFRKYTNRTAGLAFSADGRLYGCQRASRRVISFNADGSATVLTDRLDRQYYNQPKDAVADQRGRLWVTDPTSPLPHTGPQQPIPIGHQSVLLFDRRANREWFTTRITSDTISPSAIALSQDDKTLYVADGEERSGSIRELRAYPVREDGMLGPYRVLHTFGNDHRGPHRGIEGMCLDSEGNIVACAGSEAAGPGPMVYVFAPDGQLLDSQRVPADRPTACTFGDPDRGTLYVTSGQGHLFRAPNTGRCGWAIYPS